MALLMTLVSHLTVGAAAVRADQPAHRFDASGVVALLDVMDAVAAAHPDFPAKEAELGRLPEGEREAAFDRAREVNEASGEVRAAIRALLATPTYQIYFRRFTNVTAEEVSDLLLDLPYRQRRAPGQIGVTLYELVRKRGLVRSALDRLLAEADADRVYETARAFAPVWKGELPTLHLIYDSNAGSFVAEGVPFFNVFTGIDLETLSASADDSLVPEAEETMAHELQHVLAEPTLYPEPEVERSWQQDWIDQLTRGLVGEGVANLCSPPSGGIKAVYEDPEVLAALVERYDHLMRALLAGRITEDEVRAWYRENYFEVATGLLRSHLAKRHSGEELEAAVRSAMRYRPDVEHALGWWMVSRIWQRDPSPAVVAGLLEDPFSVYRLYNETLGDGDDDLRFAPDLVRQLTGADP
ncbi:MAG: hypothetical protein OES32_12030 [Acidobacteriota bacterium]|nr:hypothetical protein [Acidobacteriota bacterium]